jgi:hypothetical protein
MTIQTTAPGLGQRIEQVLLAGWNGLSAEADRAASAARQFGAVEVEAVETAIGAVWSRYLPAQVALIEGWVVEAASELASGASLEAVVTAVLNKDALAGEKAFLQGVASAVLNAVVASILATL